jgi:hypothetical protein
MGQIKKEMPNIADTRLMVSQVADLIIPSRPSFIAFPKKSQKNDSWVETLKTLEASKIDPLEFDQMLTSELNRRLKSRFGGYFLLFTFLFTAASYAIVIFNGICQWKISDVAITSLIIETPLQFIGLLYIIAKNLFPDDGTSKSFLKSKLLPRPKKGGDEHKN